VTGVESFFSLLFASLPSFGMGLNWPVFREMVENLFFIAGFEGEIIDKRYEKRGNIRNIRLV